jgi:flagellar basal body-associated protein FliL
MIELATASANLHFLTPLIQAVPVVGVMAVVIVALWRAGREHEKYARESNKENLSTLQDLSNLLTNLLSGIDKTKSEVMVKVKEEAEHTRAHIDARVNLLEEKVKNNDTGYK